MKVRITPSALSEVLALLGVERKLFSLTVFLGLAVGTLHEWTLAALIFFGGLAWAKLKTIKEPEWISLTVASIGMTCEADPLMREEFNMTILER